MQHKKRGGQAACPRMRCIRARRAVRAVCFPFLLYYFFNYFFFFFLPFLAALAFSMQRCQNCWIAVAESYLSFSSLRLRSSSARSTTRRRPRAEGRGTTEKGASGAIRELSRSYRAGVDGGGCCVPLNEDAYGYGVPERTGSAGQERSKGVVYHETKPFYDAGGIVVPQDAYDRQNSGC